MREEEEGNACGGFRSNCGHMCATSPNRHLLDDRHIAEEEEEEDEEQSPLELYQIG